jgi:hypothetical protein
MKTFYKVILTISFFINVQLFSWDSVAARYMPLQVGNVWVYSAYSFPPSFSYRFSWKITGTEINNGLTYYVLQTYPNSIVNKIRFDTTAGILRVYGGGCNWLVQERNWDSLSARLNDSAYYYCNMVYRCTDTSYVTIFNQSFTRKTFNYTAVFPLEGYNTRTFAKNIGLISDYSNNGHQTTFINISGYVINGVVYGDTSMVTGINQISSEIPEDFSLSQNYPNPFNPQTNIKFQIPESGFVKLTIFDALGREIQTIVHRQLSPGIYSVDFNGSNLPSGIYYYRIEAGSYTETKKMVLIK